MYAVHLKTHRLLLLCCFVLSGLSGLVYEVAWTRKLGLIFGSTAIAASICLAAYLGGMAAGSYLWGRLADRMRRPGWAYGAMELGIGAYGLVSLAIFDVLQPMRARFWGQLAEPFSGMLDFALVGLALLLPTMLMGGTLPALLRAVQSKDCPVQKDVGVFYSANTFGGVAGVAIAGFGLLPQIGLHGSVRFAAVLNLLLGAVVLLMFRRAEAAPTVESTNSFSPPAWIPAIVIAVSGFTALFCEVVWTRSLEPIVGSSTWSFSIILTTFLLGLAVGIAIGGRFSMRFPRIPPLVLLAASQLFAGLFVSAGLYLLNFLPLWFVTLYGAASGNTAVFLLFQGALCGSICLLPAVFTGASFPLTVASAGARATPGMAGRLYAVNTAGTIAGAFLSGLILIPWMGLRNCFLLASSLSLAMAALAVVSASEWPWRVRRIAAAVPVATAAVFVFTAPQWDRVPMMTGVFDSAPMILRDGYDRYIERLRSAKVLFYREGYGATVSVFERGNRRSIALDGRVEAGTSAATQTALGHIPAALNRDFHRAFVVGFGSGGTAGCLALHGLERVDVADLEPAVFQAAPLFSEVNHNVLSNPRVHTHAADGRSMLVGASEGSYDLILSQPSLPWAPGAAKVFTLDFYRLARSRLRPGGVYGQWFQLYNLNETGVRSMLRTFAEVFPEVLVLTAGRQAGELIMFGSDRPIRIDWNRLNALYNSPTSSADLRRVGFSAKGVLLARVLFGTREVAGIAGSAPLNTDDNGSLEFSALANIYQDRKDEILNRLFAASIDPWEYVEPRPSGEDAYPAQLEMSEAALVMRDTERGFKFVRRAVEQKESFETHVLLGDLLYATSHSEEAAQEWKRGLDFKPDDVRVVRRLVSYYQLLWPWQRPAEYSEWKKIVPAAGDDPLSGVFVNDAGQRVSGQ